MFPGVLLSIRVQSTRSENSRTFQDPFEGIQRSLIFLEKSLVGLKQELVLFVVLGAAWRMKL